MNFSLFSCLTRSTPSTSCVCHSRVALVCVWFGRPSLEREVQWDVRVRSSSCGAYCVVVHSPFGWLYHRCHCNCRDLVPSMSADYPDSADPMSCGSVCVAMSCGGGGFSPDDAYDSAWDSVLPTKGNTLSITSRTKTLLGALRCRVVVKGSLLMVLTILHGTA